MKHLSIPLLILILSSVLLMPGHAIASGSILAARSSQDFSSTLENLKGAINAEGYAVAHVQLCDGGLTDMGYQTDHYQVVFFGKVEEVREISRNHPELIPFVPFKALIFAEKGETIVSIVNPESLIEISPTLQTLQPKIEQWKQSFESILSKMRRDDATTLHASVNALH